MQRFLSPFTEPAFLALRVVLGSLFAVHGAQKLFGVLGGRIPPFGTQLWLGGVIELVTGIAIAVGFATSWAAFLASGTMAVAYVQFHWMFKGGTALFPVVNRGELALLYCFAFLYVACRGPGKWSVDARRR